MRIRKVKIQNFKCYGGMFEAELNEGINIIVGANEAGKSTILEAIHLALTGMLHGRLVRNDLSSYLFNREIEKEYLDSIITGTAKPPPSIIIEIYLSGDGPQFAELEGNDNTDRVRASGLAYRIEFDRENYGSAYGELVTSRNVRSIPVEYYTAGMFSFARKGITSRNIPVKSALIDSSSNRFQNGSDIYISRIVRDYLEEHERVQISQAHRELRETFREDGKVQSINDKISAAAKISKKSVSISVDLSSQNAWESSLITYIDEIPFHHIGKGEQCLRVCLTTRSVGDSSK